MKRDKLYSPREAAQALGITYENLGFDQEWLVIDAKEKRARPGLLVLYHQLMWSSTEEDLLKEVRSVYDGKVVSAHDLDVF